MKRKIWLIACVAIAGCLQLSAQTSDRNFISTNAPVMSAAQHGDTLFIGGRFTEVGTGCKGLARILPGSTKPDLNFPQLNNASVTAIEADGAGGFYIAGSFDDFNGEPIAATSILHILADGSRDKNFGVVDLTDGYSIYALKMKDNRLYVGGDFYAIQGAARPDLVALNAVTGKLLSWKPDPPNSVVKTILVSDSIVFIKGYFNSVGNLNCNNGFAALRADNGHVLASIPAPDTWVTAIAIDQHTLYMGGDFNHFGYIKSGASVVKNNGDLNINFPSVNGVVWAAQPDGSGGFYIGGDFSKVGDVQRNYLAHILQNGSVDPAFYVNVNSTVFTITINSNILYIGGAFTSVNGVDRSFAASVNLSNNTVTTFNPGLNEQVYALALHGDTVYLGGAFNTAKGIKRNYAAAITTGNKLTAWSPNADNYVESIVLNESGTTAYLGGVFSAIHGQDLPYLAKVNTANGSPSAWRPAPNNSISSMVLYKNLVYIKGMFTSVKNTPRQSLAAIDTATGNASPFKADFDSYSYYETGYEGLCISGNTLYVTGDFNTIQDSVRYNIARINLGTGLVDKWNSNNAVQPNGSLYTVSVDVHDNVLFGGSFTFLNTQTRNRFAAIDLSNGNFHVKSWNPGSLSITLSSINDMVHYGNTLFAGGEFWYDTASNGNSGKSMQNVLALDDSTALINHQFSQYPNNSVTALAVFNNKLMISGPFSAIDSISGGGVSYPRRNLAAYDLSGYKITPDIYDPNAEVKMITDGSGNLITAGKFTLYNYLYRQYLAAVDLKTGLATSWNPYCDGDVYALEIKDSTLYAAGLFNTIGVDRQPRSFLAALNIPTGEVLLNWGANPDAPVYTMALKDTVLYLGGGFSKFGTTKRSYAAAVNTATAALTGWNPGMNNLVKTILPVNNTVYVGGTFTKVGGGSIRYIAQVDNITGTPTTWHPNPDQPVNALATSGNNIFVGGDFTNIAGANRNALAKFDISSGILTSFDARISGRINALAIYGRNIYLMSPAQTETIGDSTRGGLAAVDTAWGFATAFNPQPVYNIYGDYNLSLWVAKNKLFTGGDWTSMEKNVSSSYFGAFTLEPRLQASGIKFTNIQSKSAVISCTKGDGEKRLIVIAQGSQPAAPADGRPYIAKATFRRGDSTAPQSFVVYNGGGNNVKVFNLAPGNTYTVSIFEYNGYGNATDYLTEPALTGSFTTRSGAAVAAIQKQPELINARLIGPKIYPNPAHNECTVSIPGNVEEEITVNIAGIKGNVLLSGIYHLNKGTNTVSFNIATLSAGVYYVNILYKNGKQQNLQFIKQ